MRLLALTLALLALDACLQAEASGLQGGGLAGGGNCSSSSAACSVASIANAGNENVGGTVDAGNLYTPGTLSVNGASQCIGGIVLPGTSGAQLSVAANGRVCLDGEALGAACVLGIYSDGTNLGFINGSSVNWYLSGATLVGNNSTSTIDLAGAGTINLGTAQATSVVLGGSTTTKPVKVAGGSGAFVGSAALSSGSQTFTVPTGAKCVCSVTNAFLACQVSVSGTTATVTVTGGGSDNVVVICL